MDVTVDRDVLYRALHLVDGVVEARQTLPILSHLCLTTAPEALQAEATDLELRVRVRVPATVTAPGGATAPAGKFRQVIRELPGGMVQLRGEKDGMHLTAGLARFRLMGLPVDEFPPFPLDGAFPWIPIEMQVLHAHLARTAHAISDDTSRPFLGGILCRLRPGEIRCVATDGHRMAESWGPCAYDGEPIGGIIPQKAVESIRKLADAGAGQVALRPPDAVAVTVGGTELISKLVEGPFPNYEQVLPKAHPARVTMPREPLMAAVRRVAVLSTDRGHAIRLEFAPGRCVLTGISSELGEATETLEIPREAATLAIGFNAKYLLDLLGSFAEETVSWAMKDALSPLLVETEGQRAMIMPMRI